LVNKTEREVTLIDAENCTLLPFYSKHQKFEKELVKIDRI
jgi:hypothetical protein